jgi:hypothetical protein
MTGRPATLHVAVSYTGKMSKKRSSDVVLGRVSVATEICQGFNNM